MVPDTHQRTYCNEPVLSPDDNHAIALGSQLRYEYPSLFYTDTRSLNTTKKTDLEHYACSLKPDVIALTETWLTDKNEETGSINNDNMFTAHRCNSQVGSSVCVYVNSLMNAIKIDSMVTKTNSAVWVRIMKPKQQSIIIGCLYHPTSKTGQDSTNTIDYLAKLSNRYKNSKFILFRDFNHLSMEAISEAFRLCK